MELCLLGAMAVMLLMLAALILVGGRALQGEARPEGEPARWPAAALVVPVTGAAPGLADRLRALLIQDYPDYQVIFATRAPEDPATPLIQSVMADCPRARHVVGGPASACGQKNHNLLAGIKLAGDAPAILAFCDSNQLAPPTFLTDLVRPLVAGDAAVVSGYHHIIPQDHGIAATGRAVTVLTLLLTKPFRRLNQPWGGATAIRRAVFSGLGVEKLWAENVVDDVSLAARLAGAGLWVAFAPAAVLDTPLGGETLSGWSSWLTRQWLFLKFCLPLSWLAAGLVLHLLLALVVLAGVRVLLLPWGWCPPGPGLAAALFLAMLTVLGLRMRRLHPRPGPRGLWLAAAAAALAMAGWCHLKTCFTRRLTWRGITYRVTRRGKVTEILED